MRQRGQPTMPPIGRVRYVVALITGHGYVVWDRRQSRVADGLYGSLADAQWAADQRNRGWRTDEGA